MTQGDDIVTTTTDTAMTCNPGYLHRLELALPEHAEAPPPEWLHMCIRHRETSQFLMEDEHLDEIIVSAMVAPETRSRIVLRGNGVMVLLKAMHLREGADPEHFAAVRLWIDKNRIISTREEDIDAILQMRELIEAGKGPQTTGQFLAGLIGSVYRDLGPLVEELEDQLHELDQRLASNDADDLFCGNLGKLRRRIAAFLHQLTPHKAVLESLMNSKCSFFSEVDHFLFVEHHDTLSRFLETLDDLRDRGRIADDQINRIQAGRIERINFLFTMVATIFLPISFLTGLFGVNLQGIPFSQNESAFVVFCVVCIAVVGLTLWAFRRRGLY